jgi:hypothetical protein
MIELCHDTLIQGTILPFFFLADTEEAHKSVPAEIQTGHLPNMFKALPFEPTWQIKFVGGQPPTPPSAMFLVKLELSVSKMFRTCALLMS